MIPNSIDKENFVVTKPNSGRSWLIASIASMVVLGIGLGMMKSLGLFEILQDARGVKVLAAAIGLVGTVLSASVTLIGIVIKYSIDDRNSRQAAIDATRNYVLASQAEQRNRIEAAIRAVDLLSENIRTRLNTKLVEHC